MIESVRKLSLAYLLFAGCALLVPGLACGADANQGKVIAERWCSGCHVVGPSQKSAAADQAPTFASIAARTDFGDEKLAVLLLAPHSNMPKLTLSRFEIADLAEYIRTLK
jgi:mono/diheme cytochrome c family protein